MVLPSLTWSRNDLFEISFNTSCFPFAIHGSRASGIRDSFHVSGQNGRQINDDIGKRGASASYFCAYAERDRCHRGANDRA